MSETTQLNNESPDLTDGHPDTLNPEPGADPNAIADLKLRYGIRLGGYGLLVPESVESEVLIRPDIFPIPNTIDWMSGLISIRGRFAPVFDLGKMLELSLNNCQTSIIVLKIKDDFLAFPFDTAHSLELPPSVSENDLKLPETLSRFSGNLYQIDQEFWIEFDFKTCMEQFASRISQ